MAAEDLDEDLEVTIQEVKLEAMRDPKTNTEVEKPVLFVEELAKGVVLNKTNWALIAKACDNDDSEEWPGKKITLTVAEVSAFGDVVAAIRVKLPRKPVADF